MWFQCDCGHIIRDTTDDLSYKGTFFTNQDIASSKDIWDLDDKSRMMYLCPNCGNLFIDKDARDFYYFAPIGERRTNLLQSVFREQWRGYLFASWYEVKPDWLEEQGLIIPDINGKIDIPEFNDFEGFQAAFYDVFEKLKEKGVLKYARMDWNYKSLKCKVLFDWRNKKEKSANQKIESRKTPEYYPIHCFCGNIISEKEPGGLYLGHVLTDQDWGDVTDTDEDISISEMLKYELRMHLCPDCGMLYLWDEQEGVFRAFVSSEDAAAIFTND